LNFIQEIRKLKFFKLWNCFRDKLAQVGPKVESGCPGLKIESNSPKTNVKLGRLGPKI